MDDGCLLLPSPFLLFFVVGSDFEYRQRLGGVSKFSDSTRDSRMKAATIFPEQRQQHFPKTSMTNMATTANSGTEDEKENDLHPLMTASNDHFHDEYNDEEDPAEKRQRKSGGTNNGILMLRRMISDVSTTAAVAAAATTSPSTFPSSHLSTSSSSSSLVRHWLSTICWVGFGLMGWYVPRYILDRKFDTILAKKAPYQIFDTTTNTGVQGTSSSNQKIVVLDFLLNNPVVDPPTVDGHLLRLTGIALPLLIMIVYTAVVQTCYFNNNNRNSSSSSSTAQQQQHQQEQKLRSKLLFLSICTLISAFSMAVGISEGTTVMIKQWVQRRRPNFYHLCGFSTRTLECTATPPEIVVEAQLSFPSGHSSLISCGMTFLSMYLHHPYAPAATGMVSSSTTATATISNTTAASFFWKTLCPFFFALFVASSRVVDYWHHPSDIIAGLLLGSVSSFLTFRFWYCKNYNDRESNKDQRSATAVMRDGVLAHQSPDDNRNTG